MTALLPSLRRLPILSAIFLLSLIFPASSIRAQEPDPGPRLVQVDLPPGMTIRSLQEAGLDLIEVRGASRARLLEWPGDEGTIARLGGMVTGIDPDPARRGGGRARAGGARGPRARGRRGLGRAGTGGS